MATRSTRKPAAPFLSTLSLRRATQALSVTGSESQISIHALLAESDSQQCCTDTTSAISIHALLAESDYSMTLKSLTAYQFLSTLSLRRATSGGCRVVIDRIFLSTLSLRRATRIRISDAVKADISIHALLAESDKHAITSLIYKQHFYPRSPCGERLYNLVSGCKAKSISIHALLAESDITL